MKAKLNATLHNRFDVVKKNILTGEESQVAYAENIILNQAWSAFLSFGEAWQWDPSWWKSIFYGTGTGTLSPTRTALFTPLSSKSIDQTTWGYNADENWYSCTRRITLNPEEHVGAVLTEVGVGGSAVYTHAMLKDMDGNIVSITKTALDIIYIYGTVYVYIAEDYSPDLSVDVFRCYPSSNQFISALLGTMPTSRSSGTFNDRYHAGVPRSFAIYEGEPIPAVGTNPSYLGALYDTGDDYTIMTRSLDSANRKITFTFRLPAPSGNGGSGVKSGILYYNGDNSSSYNRTSFLFRWPSAGHTQDPVEDDLGSGDGLTTGFATSFPFVKAGAEVYVDGILAAPTISLGLPKEKNIAKYMKRWGLSGNGYDATGNRFPASSNTNDLIVENPFYATHGIDSMTCSYVTVFGSDDMVTWVQKYTTGSSGATYTVAAADKQLRYWKFVKSGSNSWTVSAMNCDALDEFKNVTFASPPGLVTGEAVGTGDGIESSFALDHEPIAESLTVYLNGIETTDYDVVDGIIGFTTAPGSGVAITADYRFSCLITAIYDTDIVAKDSNHVLDVTIVVQLNEYTPV